MAKMTSRSYKTPVVTFNGGEIRAVISSKKFVVNTPALNGVSREQLADFKDAVNMMGRHLASIFEKPFSPRGTKTDPDEPEIIPNANLTVVFRIFPKDSRYSLAFTRYAETGKVLGYLKAMTFSDIPSLVQVGFVANLAANLMRSYEEME